MTGDLVAVFFFVFVGWAALWPARHRLGPVAYHLAALPTGLLAGPLAGSFSTLTGRPLDLVSAAAGALVLVAAAWGVQRLAFGSGAPGDEPFAWRGFAITSGALGLSGVVLGLARFTTTNYDSIAAYWPIGVELSRKGAFTERLMASRSPLIPTMNAIHASFGSDWAYVVYPLLGATLLAWLAMTLWRGPLGSVSRRTKLFVAGGAVVFLALEPSFLFHSFFVHTHMASALYLLMSLTCLWLAVHQNGARRPGEAEPAFLVLAGLCAAGLTLSRPDGLAYQFVPVAAAIAVLTLSKVRWKQVAAFFAPLLFLVIGVHAAAYVTLGIWPSSKLSGRTVLAILAVLAVSAVGPWIVQVLDRHLPFRVAGERFLALLVSVAAALSAIVLALKWETALDALVTARINLFEGAGGYHYLWYAVVAVLVLGLVSRDALKRESWTRSPFLAIALFFVIAALVHGTSHEGRVSVGDSFNRVAFHALPLVIWFAAAVVARILARPEAAEPVADEGAISDEV